MLDEEENAKAYKLYGNGFKLGGGGGSRKERFKDVLDYYNELTGWNETEPNAIMHHAIDMYGPPCEKCGKPYRTSRATFCAACGNKRPL